MAVTIVTTAGSATANSFITLAEADAFMEARLNASTWETDATDDTKNRALVEATRELNVLGWDGNRTDDTQALAWPRQWAVNPDDPNGDYYATTTVPQRVKDATAELAFQFVKAGTTDVAALDSSAGVLEKTIDVLTTKYSEHGRADGLDRYPRVMAYVRPLLALGVSSLMTEVVRG